VTTAPTSYSGTFAPVQPDGSIFTIRDPLAEARDLLRQAARLPFHASRPQAWQAAFRQAVTDARAAIRHHIWSAELPDSPLNRAEMLEPRLLPKVDQQREEHEAFASRAGHLVAEASAPGVVNIWKMIELSEQAILLEMALARHHNRLTQIVFETTHRDLGEAG
jgi:hypothetical protein